MIAFSVAPNSLHRLRRRLRAVDAASASDILRDAGTATGIALSELWTEELLGRCTLANPDALDSRWFGPLLSGVCHRLGWGELAVSVVDDRALILTADQWAESEAANEPTPGCHFTTGCFAAFLSARSDRHFGVREVECRSAGAGCCRFVAGAPEVIALIDDLLAAGGDWRDAFTSVDQVR